MRVDKGRNSWNFRDKKYKDTYHSGEGGGGKSRCVPGSGLPLGKKKAKKANGNVRRQDGRSDEQKKKKKKKGKKDRAAGVGEDVSEPQRKELCDTHAACMVAKKNKNRTTGCSS